MSEPTAANSEKFFSLPKRDLILLPLISLCTILLVLGAAELGSRAIWKAYSEGSCLVKDKRVGFKWIPNCTAHVKIAESGPVTYQFNECGFRSSESCGPKKRGVQRVVALGSSSVLGYWVATEDVLSEALAADLTQACHHKVESQNLGVPGATLYNMADRVDEAIALKPDLVLVGVSSSDLYDTLQTAAPAPAEADSEQPKRVGPVARLRQILKDASHDSRLVTVSRHFMYQNPTRYIQAMLLRGDGASMQKPLDALWERRLQITDEAFGDMSTKLSAAGIPLVVVYFPDLGQTEVLKNSSSYPDLDPYLLRNRVKELADKHNILFVDPLDEFKQDADPGSYFFAADGHMNGPGHRKLEKIALQRVMSSDLPAFNSCNRLAASTGVEKSAQ